MGLGIGLYIILALAKEGQLLDPDGRPKQVVPYGVGLILLPGLYLVDEFLVSLPDIVMIFPTVLAHMYAPLALLAGLWATSFLVIGIGAVTTAITHLLVENYV